MKSQLKIEVKFPLPIAAGMSYTTAQWCLDRTALADYVREKAIPQLCVWTAAVPAQYFDVQTHCRKIIRLLTRHPDRQLLWCMVGVDAAVVCSRGQGFDWITEDRVNDWTGCITSLLTPHPRECSDDRVWNAIANPHCLLMLGDDTKAHCSRLASAALALGVRATPTAMAMAVLVLDASSIVALAEAQIWSPVTVSHFWDELTRRFSELRGYRPDYPLAELSVVAKALAEQDGVLLTIPPLQHPYFARDRLVWTVLFLYAAVETIPDETVHEFAFLRLNRAHMAG